MATVRYRDSNIYIHSSRKLSSEGKWRRLPEGNFEWDDGSVTNAIGNNFDYYDFARKNTGEFDRTRVERVISHLDQIGRAAIGRALLREVQAYAPQVVEIISDADETCGAVTGPMRGDRARPNGAGPRQEWVRRAYGFAIAGADSGIVYHPFEEDDPWCRIENAGKVGWRGDETLAHELFHAIQVFANRPVNETPIEARLPDIESLDVPTFSDMMEFQATTFANIYISERSPGAPLRWGHPWRLARPMRGPLLDPRKFLAVFYDEFTLLRDQHLRLFLAIQSMKHIRWNPIAFWSPESPNR